MSTTAPGHRTPTVIIVGAGLGGMSVALELKAAGIDTFTVVERAPEVGGVWQANAYPGARCDVPSVIYQFSSHLRAGWSRRFGSQAEIRDYVRQVSIESGVRSHIRFNAEVVSAVFDDAARRWTVELATGERLSAQVLVTATGQLSRPRFPDVDGRDRFAGAQFHSARWDHEVELGGKRVLVVGGGASTVQIVPAIVDIAAHTTVIQRSPNWVMGKYDWSPGFLERAVSGTRAGLRAYYNLMWLWYEARYPIVLRKLDLVRSLCEAHGRSQIRKRLRDPEKISACLPDHRMGCARILLSREWYPTLARDDVSVVRGSVTSMTSGGVVTADRRHIDADVVIWCTGFTATEYLAPIRITGRNGLDLYTAWKDGPEAYLGLSTPGFPNMFMSYGPNTGSLTNTITSILQYQAAYIRQAVQHIGRAGGAIEIRRDVHEAFNTELRRRFHGTVFNTGCSGWYTTASGKVTTVSVGSHIEYRRRTRTFDPAVYQAVAFADHRHHTLMERRKS